MTTKIEKQIAIDTEYCSSISWLLLNFAVEEQLAENKITFEERVIVNSFLSKMYHTFDIPRNFLVYSSQKTAKLHGYQIGVVRLIDMTIQHIKERGYVDDDPHKV